MDLKRLLQNLKLNTRNIYLKNKLKINYSFYITNQIMKPVIQLR